MSWGWFLSGIRGFIIVYCSTKPFFLQGVWEKKGIFVGSRRRIQIWVYRSPDFGASQGDRGVGATAAFPQITTFSGEGGKELRRLRWSFPPCPEILWVAVKSFGHQILLEFLTLSKALLGKGAGTISNAEVSRPLPPGRSANAFGHCLPIPCPPWLGFIAEKPQFTKKEAAEAASFSNL